MKKLLITAPVVLLVGVMAIWQVSKSRRIIEETRSRVRPGSIILLHAMYQSRQQFLQAVRGIIESLEREGYRFVTVSELLAAANQKKFL